MTDAPDEPAITDVVRRLFDDARALAERRRSNVAVGPGEIAALAADVAGFVAVVQRARSDEVTRAQRLVLQSLLADAIDNLTSDSHILRALADGIEAYAARPAYGLAAAGIGALLTSEETLVSVSLLGAGLAALATAAAMRISCLRRESALATSVRRIQRLHDMVDPTDIAAER